MNRITKCTMKSNNFENRRRDSKKKTKRYSRKKSKMKKKCVKCKRTQKNSRIVKESYLLTMKSTV